MIVNFTLKNYNSFRHQADLTLEAGQSRNSNVVLTPALSSRAPSILPAVGIFGANASGKSNILKALDYLVQVITGMDSQGNSIKSATSSRLLDRFAFDGNHEPIEFELELFNPVILREYRYNVGVSNKIVYESLTVCEKKQSNRVQRTIFTREYQSIEFDHQTETELGDVKKVLAFGDDILTITQLANLIRLPIARDFQAEVGAITIIDRGAPFNLKELYDDPALLRKVTNVVKGADTSIQDIEVKKLNIPDSMRRKIMDDQGVPEDIKNTILGEDFFATASMHKNYSSDSVTTIPLSLDHESNGTNKLIAYAPSIIHAIEDGGVLVVDELDSGFHPYISAKIVETFLDPKINTKGAQLIFTSHEDYLMSKNVNLRTDQIYLVSKNRQEQSELVSLAEYNIRNDAAIDRKYMDGRLGGVPIVSEGGFELDG